MTSERFRYRAFGLDVESDIMIAHLRPREAPLSGPDRKLTVRAGEVEPTLLTVPGLRRGLVRRLFRYEVRNGAEVTIDCLPGADHRDITDMLISRVMTVVMYQRGMLPLHASAVCMSDGIVALCGPSGVGKSTLAAALAQRGHGVAGDDMLPVRAATGQIPRAWPGAPRLKLSPATLDYLGCEDDDAPLANTQEGKVLAGFASPGCCGDAGLLDEGLRLKAIVRMRRGPLAIEPLRPLDVMADWPLVARSTDLLPVADRPEEIWQQWLNVVGRVPAVELGCTGEFSGLSETAGRLEEYLQSGR